MNLQVLVFASRSEVCKEVEVHQDEARVFWNLSEWASLQDRLLEDCGLSSGCENESRSRVRGLVSGCSRHFALPNWDA